MNIAVINAKDLFKYILKFLVIFSIIFFMVKILKMVDLKKQEDNIKENSSNIKKQINEYSFTKCLDISIPLMEYGKEKSEKEKFFTNNKILAMGAGILDESILKNTELLINEKELTNDDTEELINKIATLPENATTETVQENNITPKVTSSYGSVQINNQSDYEITEDMLIPDIEITNKKEILIYHTHTCESYTPSPRI
ncbi:MAG: stage II sporulation protein P [Clostridia bacterium]